MHELEMFTQEDDMVRFKSDRSQFILHQKT